MSAIKLYFSASSTQNGALGIFHVYAVDAYLADDLDAHLGGRSGPLRRKGLLPNELRYGWLHSKDGRIVDEVMLGCPMPGVRILMTHGGAGIRQAVTAFFETSGYENAEKYPENRVLQTDPLHDPLLASCRTEAQAAGILRWRAEGGPFPETLMATHRIVLAGPPNAGKSSLLNALCGYDRAFVDAHAGATRDVVDETVELAGHTVWLGDMPGYDPQADALTDDAWRRAQTRLTSAEWIWFVVDAHNGWDAPTQAAAHQVFQALNGDLSRVLLVANKNDLGTALTGSDQIPDVPSVAVCSLEGGNAREVFERWIIDVFGCAR